MLCTVVCVLNAMCNQRSNTAHLLLHCEELICNPCFVVCTTANLHSFMCSGLYIWNTSEPVTVMFYS